MIFQLMLALPIKVPDPMPDNPTAMSPADQPTVNQLTRQCRLYTRQITARNWQTQALPLVQNITQLFILTGDPHLADYMDGT
jgi:hypothetical protein